MTDKHASSHFDKPDASLERFLEDWPFETWDAEPFKASILSFPRGVVFGFKSEDQERDLALVLAPDQAQQIANELTKAAEAAILLMVMEASQGEKR